MTKTIIAVSIENINSNLIPIAPRPKLKMFMLMHEVNFFHGDLCIKIPRSFHWDGASIPKLLTIKFGSGFSPIHIISSLFHDYLYSKVCKVEISRKEADQLYRDILIKLGKSRTLAKAEYLALRLWGWRSYKKK